MRRAGDIALLVVQWGLVLIGLYMMLVALHLYSIETNWAGTPHASVLGKDTYVLPTWQRLVQGMTTGFIALGLGALLFYVRRLYLSRRQ